MFQAIGRDRVDAREDGSVNLSTPFEKGWRARLDGTKTDAEHPGTAVDTGDELWEVVELQPLTSGVRYRLRPWREEHTIRDLEHYDEESENRRAEERRKKERRESRGRLTFFLAMFAGHLPGHVQSHMESEYGVAATRLSIMSAAPLVFGSLLGMAISATNAMMNEAPLIPVRLVPLLYFFFVESSIRLLFVTTQRRPVGSLLGTLGYRLYLLTGAEAAPQTKGMSATVKIPVVETPEEIVVRDRLKLREPLLALLSAGEQRSIETRYGISLAEAGGTGAVALILVAALGVAVSSPPFASGSQVASFLVALYFFVEQVVRLALLVDQKRAGSLLGILARPFVGRYLRLGG